MALDTHVTEIADSEDEPLTSSPAPVSDAAVDKLSVTPRQDAQTLACPHQTPTEPTANEHAIRSDARQKRPSSNVDTVHLAQIGSLPAPQPATNSPATIITVSSESQVNSDMSAVHAGITVSDVHCQTACVDTDVADSGTSNARDTKVFPEMQLATRYDDPAHVFSNRRELAQYGLAGHLSVKTPRNADGEASAEDFQRGIAFERSVRTPVSSTDPPVRVTNTGHSAPCTTYASNAMGLKWSPAADDLAASLRDAARSVTVTALPEPCGVYDPTKSVKLKQVITSVTATSAPPSDAEPTTNLNDRDLSGNIDPQINSAQSIAAPVFEPGCEHLRSQYKALGSTLQASAPVVSPIEQKSEEVHASAASAAAVPEDVPRYLAQTKTEANLSPCSRGPKIRDNQDPATIAPVTQPQLQATALESGQHVSPRPTAILTSQEITIAELRAQKSALLASLGALPAIRVLIEEDQPSDVDMSDGDGVSTDADITAAANKIVKGHIKLLHEYNELKDVGQGLMGLIADQRGVRIVEVQDQFGIDAND